MISWMLERMVKTHSMENITDSLTYRVRRPGMPVNIEAFSLVNLLSVSCSSKRLEHPKKAPASTSLISLWDKSSFCSCGTLANDWDLIILMALLLSIRSVVTVGRGVGISVSLWSEQSTTVPAIQNLQCEGWLDTAKHKSVEKGKR